MKYPNFTKALAFWFGMGYYIFCTVCDTTEKLREKERRFMVSFTRKAHYSIDDLLEILKLLRGEGGCPWDREQTHSSIRSGFIE